jgi:hypothetical protein
MAEAQLIEGEQQDQTGTKCGSCSQENPDLPADGARIPRASMVTRNPDHDTEQSDDRWQDCNPGQRGDPQAETNLHRRPPTHGIQGDKTRTQAQDAVEGEEEQEGRLHVAQGGARLGPGERGQAPEQGGDESGVAGDGVKSASSLVVVRNTDAKSMLEKLMPK